MEGSTIEHSQNRQRELDGDRRKRILRAMGRSRFLLQNSFILFGWGFFVSFFGANVTRAGFFVGATLCLILIITSIPVGFTLLRNYSPTSRPTRDPWGKVRKRVDPGIALDLQSITWVLCKSLNETVRFSAFKYFISIPELPELDPTLVTYCFRIFIACIRLKNNKVVIRPGSERLATISARCLFRTFHHLSITDPTSSILEGFHQCYDSVFPLGADFRGLPLYHTMTMIHILVKKRLSPGPIEWDNQGLSTQERVPLAWYMAKAAQVGYEETERRKVPRWILRFALDSLPLNPPPPPSVVADCLIIIAVDLECDVSNIAVMDKRCVQTGWISARLIQN